MAALFGSKPASKATGDGARCSGANIWIAASDGDLKRVKELAAAAAATAAASATGTNEGDASALGEKERASASVAAVASQQAARTACLSAKDEHGYSALHAAASYGHLELLAFLLAEGVSPDLRDEDGDAALHVCATGECAELLLGSGADGGAKNDEGKTPVESNAEHVVQLLQVLGAKKDGEAAAATIKEGEEEGEGEGELEGADDGDLAKLQTMTTAAELLGLEPDAASAREELGPLLQVALVLAKAGHCDVEMVQAMAVLAQGVIGAAARDGAAGGGSGGGGGGGVGDDGSEVGATDKEA